MTLEEKLASLNIDTTSQHTRKEKIEYLEGVVEGQNIRLTDKEWRIQKMEEHIEELKKKKGDLVVQNHYLERDLEAERKTTKFLQTKLNKIIRVLREPRG